MTEGEAKPATSIWVKLIAVCLVLLVCGYFIQSYRTNKLNDCRADAARLSMMYRVHDVRLNWFQCEYLMQSIIRTDTVAPIEWEPQHIFDMFADMEDRVRSRL